jgi:hypothetical protein
MPPPLLFQLKFVPWTWWEEAAYEVKTLCWYLNDSVFDVNRYRYIDMSIMRVEK